MRTRVNYFTENSRFPSKYYENSEVLSDEF